MKKISIYVLVGVVCTIFGAILENLYFGSLIVDNRELIRNNQLSMTRVENSVNKEIKDFQKDLDTLTAENKTLRQEIKILKEKSIDLDKMIHSKDVSIVQGVNRKQLRSIIENTLSYLGEKNLKKFTDLLMITAQIESDLGFYYKQVRGPAVGVFQMEPFTEKSVWNDYLKYKPEISKKIKNLRIVASLDSRELEYNIAYSTAMAYSLYKWRKVDPKDMDPMKLVEIHKKVYNTHLGKSTTLKSIKKLRGSRVTEG